MKYFAIGASSHKQINGKIRSCIYLNILANHHENDRDELIIWYIPDEYEKVRQDINPNGIVSQYTYNQLSESSGANI